MDTQSKKTRTSTGRVLLQTFWKMKNDKILAIWTAYTKAVAVL